MSKAFIVAKPFSHYAIILPTIYFLNALLSTYSLSLCESVFYTFLSKVLLCSSETNTWLPASQSLKPPSFSRPLLKNFSRVLSTTTVISLYILQHKLIFAKLPKLWGINHCCCRWLIEIDVEINCLRTLLTNDISLCSEINWSFWLASSRIKSFQ